MISIPNDKVIVVVPVRCYSFEISPCYLRPSLRAPVVSFRYSFKILQPLFRVFAFFSMKHPWFQVATFSSSPTKGGLDRIQHCFELFSVHDFFWCITYYSPRYF